MNPFTTNLFPTQSRNITNLPRMNMITAESGGIYPTNITIITQIEYDWCVSALPSQQKNGAEVLVNENAYIF